jgi:hypothetical protein
MKTLTGAVIAEPMNIPSPEIGIKVRGKAQLPDRSFDDANCSPGNNNVEDNGDEGGDASEREEIEGEAESDNSSKNVKDE